MGELYNQIQQIYEAEFSEMNYDQVNDYENASSHPIKYTCISYSLLQLADSLPDLPIKLWSLIPNASNSIVHVPLSGVSTMYHFLRKAHANNLPVPENLIRAEDNNFIRLTDFDYLYFLPQNKRDLWNAIFDLQRIQNEGLELGFGMKTDSHMISILFEKTALNFVPQNKKEVMVQKIQKNISN